LKIFFLENHWAKVAHIYMKSFWHSADLSFYKLWSPRVKVEDTREKTIFTFVYWNLLKWNICPISIKLGTNISCMIMMGIQVYSYEGPSLLYKSAKVG
jgi:hypothetical protein